MADDFAEDDPDDVLEQVVNEREGKLPVSGRAQDLHCLAFAHSFSAGHPGFIPDSYLETLHLETVLSPFELCTAGLWRRISGGYLIMERDMLARIADLRAAREERAWECLRSGGHVTGDGDQSRWCSRCGNAVPAAIDSTKSKHQPLHWTISFGPEAQDALVAALSALADLGLAVAIVDRVGTVADGVLSSVETDRVVCSEWDRVSATPLGSSFAVVLDQVARVDVY